MDVLLQIKLMQTVRNLNITDTAERLGTTRQNLSNKMSRNRFTVNELEAIADVLDFDMEIVFTDRKTGRKI